MRNFFFPRELSTGVKNKKKIIIIIIRQEGTGQNRKTLCFNDIIWRAFGAAWIPAVKEPSGQNRQDGKRPDGLTLIPRHGDRLLVWDVTFVSPLAALYDNS